MLFLDVNINQHLANWLNGHFPGIEALSAHHIAFDKRADNHIWQYAREAAGIILTKDKDFLTLYRKLGPPPSLLLLKKSDRSNAEVRQMLLDQLPAALRQLEAGETFVELGWS